MNVKEAVETRCSIRAFLDKPVDMQLLTDLLRIASRAPSGGNLQPWNIHVVGGERMVQLKALMKQRLAEAPAGEGAEYDIYPKALASPYKDRRNQVGHLLYNSLGIARDDSAGRAAQFQENFQFFGAPVALFCYLERTHGAPQWSDAGMFLQTLMLLLREHDLDSCAQECWALYPQTMSKFLGTPDQQMLFCGMSIGYRDPKYPANNISVPRAPLEEFTHFHLHAV